MSAKEKMLTGRDFVCGKTVTAADVYVGSMIGWGATFNSIPACPAFEAYAQRVRARPVYASAKAIDSVRIAAIQRS